VVIVTGMLAHEDEMFSDDQARSLHSSTMAEKADKAASYNRTVVLAARD
jgi:hypothetical protein